MKDETTLWLDYANENLESARIFWTAAFSTHVCRMFNSVLRSR